MLARIRGGLHPARNRHPVCQPRIGQNLSARNTAAENFVAVGAVKRERGADTPLRPERDARCRLAVVVPARRIAGEDLVHVPDAGVAAPDVLRVGRHVSVCPSVDDRENLPVSAIGDLHPQQRLARRIPDVDLVRQHAAVFVRDFEIRAVRGLVVVEIRNERRGNANGYRHLVRKSKWRASVVFPVQRRRKAMRRTMRSEVGKRKKHRYAKDAHSAYTYAILHTGIIPKNRRKSYLRAIATVPCAHRRTRPCQ